MRNRKFQKWLLIFLIPCLLGAVFISSAPYVYVWTGTRVVLSGTDFATDAASCLDQTWIIPVSLTVTTNTTIPLSCELSFWASGKLTIDVSKVVTINGMINARPKQIFAGSGTVDLSANAQIAQYEVTWWGTNTVPGTTDLASAFNAALTAIGANASLHIPRGTYNLASTVTISNQRVNIFGDGRHTTKIYFTPTANGTMFKFDAPSTAVLYQGTFRDVSLWSADTTYVKTAIEMIDTSTYILENIVIGGDSGYWKDTATEASKGLYTLGREALCIRNFFAYANKPIVIGPQPNGGIQISADHFNYHNLYLSARLNPNITIESGSVLTQVSFTGYQAWVAGTGGLYWVDGTSPGASNGLVLENVRFESNSDPNNKYFVHIDITSALQGFLVKGGQTGVTKGFYLRQLAWGTIQDFSYTDTSREALNITNTASFEELNIINSFWQTGSTASTTNVTISHKEPSQTSMVLPMTGRLIPTLTYNQNEIIETSLTSTEVSIANNGTYALGGTDATGLVLITTREPAVAEYALLGSSATTAERYDSAGTFTITKDTAASWNVYWNAASSQYYLQNKRGSTILVRVVRLGRGA